MKTPHRSAIATATALTPPSALAIAIALAFALALASCSSSTSTPAPGTSGATAPPSGGGAGVLGDPCVPKVEDDAKFLGFDELQVNIEPQSPSCAAAAPVCLINHFRGRVSCPYGQTVEGAAPAGAQPCTTPDTHAAVTGAGDALLKALVAPQCADRTADETVYCSCRCANANGDTNDGQNYCTCGDGFACTPLVTSIGADPDNITGSYCMKANTAYDGATACMQDCNPAMHACK